MKTRTKVLFVLGISLVLVLFAYYIGSIIVNDRYYFEAEIISINDTSIIVDGFDTNDINHKGEFSFAVTKTKIYNNKKIVDYSELKIGDKVGIEYTGSVMESYPAQIDVIELSVIN